MIGHLGVVIRRVALGWRGMGGGGDCLPLSELRGVGVALVHSFVDGGAGCGSANELWFSLNCTLYWINAIYSCMLLSSLGFVILYFYRQAERQAGR